MLFLILQILNTVPNTVRQCRFSYLFYSDFISFTVEVFVRVIVCLRRGPSLGFLLRLLYTVMFHALENPCLLYRRVQLPACSDPGHYGLWTSEGPLTGSTSAYWLASKARAGQEE